MPGKKIDKGISVPPPTAVVQSINIKVPNSVPDPAVQKSFSDMGVKAVARSVDDGSHIHHHVIVNCLLFACYETPSAASLAVDRVLGLPDGHAAFERSFTSEYDICRHAEWTRTSDDRVRSEDGAGDVREADDPRSKKSGSPVYTAKIEPRKPAKASEKGKTAMAQGG